MKKVLLFLGIVLAAFTTMAQAQMLRTDSVWQGIVETIGKGNQIVGSGKIIYELEHDCGGTAFFGGVLLQDGNVLLVPFNSDKIVIYNPLDNKIVKNLAIYPKESYVKLRSNESLNGTILRKSIYHSSFCPEKRVILGGLTPSAAQFNGKIYTIAYSDEDTLLLKPFRDKPLLQSTTHTISTSSPNREAYAGGVLLPNGRVVLIPYRETRILVYDPESNSIVQQCPAGKFEHRYKGGVLLNDGTVLLAPVQTQKIDIYDPVQNKIAKSLDIQNEYYGWNFYGATLMPDGSVALSPTFGKRFPFYDPKNNTLIGTALKPNDGTFTGSCLTADGKVCYVPEFGHRIYVADQKDVSDSCQLPERPSWTGLTAGCALLPTGDILLTPSWRKLSIYSPKLNKIIQTLEKPDQDFAGAAGSLVLPNGDVVLLPHGNSRIRVYRPDYAKPVFFSKEACLSPYLNKF